MLKLIIEDDEGRKTVIPFVRDELTIGRQEGNAIRLTERNVSRRHARLLQADGGVLVEDLGSANGVRVNGERIDGRVPITNGDLIEIGDYDLALEAEPPADDDELDTAPTPPPAVRLPDPVETQPALPAVALPPEVAADAPTPRRSAPPGLKNQATAVIRLDQLEPERARAVSALDAAHAPRLVVLNTELAGREFRLARTEIRIGRTDDNDVALDHRSLSRTHCRLVREDTGEWRVSDLQSANGLMVNGESYAQVTLRFGDVLELGHVKLQFLGPSDVPTLPIPAGAAAAKASGSKTGVLVGVGAGLLVVAVVVAWALLSGGGGEAAARPSPPIAVRPKPPPVAAVAVPEATPVPTEPPPAAPPDPDERARALYQEAMDLSKQKQLEAALERLQRCVAVSPEYFNCYKQLGSVHAKIASRDSSAADQEKARRYYQRFLELAPPEDEAVPKVKRILEMANTP